MPKASLRYVIYSPSLGVFIGVLHGRAFFSICNAGVFWMVPTFPTRKEASAIIEGWHLVNVAADIGLYEVETEYGFVSPFVLAQAGLPAAALSNLAVNMPTLGQA